MSNVRRVEYIVFIPDDFTPEKRRAVGRYQEIHDGEPGATLAAEHVAHLHRLAATSPHRMRRGEAFAVEQVITISETPIVVAASHTPTEETV